jgi:hypothetical protein
MRLDDLAAASGDESPAYKAAPHEWGLATPASQIDLALFSRPGIYAGATFTKRTPRKTLTQLSVYIFQ